MMSVFEDIDHAKISTILLSAWAFIIPGIAALGVTGESEKEMATLEKTTKNGLVMDP